MSLNLLDGILLVILLASIVLSVMKGFFRELLGMASIVAAFLVGAWFYRTAAEPFKEVVKSENYALFLGFSIVFLGTLLAGVFLIWITQKIIKFAKIQWFDRVLGAGFGFIRGWLLGSIVLLVLTSFDLQAERVKSSQLAPYYLPGARLIAVAAPRDLKARFTDGYLALEGWWRENSLRGSRP
jgi:membrane protein required for colicin V production